MNDSQKTIELLRPIALSVGNVLRNHMEQAGGDPCWFHRNNWDGKTFQVAAWAGDGIIEYRCNRMADIRIQGIDIAKINPDDIEVGPIVPMGPQQTVRAHIMSTYNRLDEDIEREVLIKDIQNDIDNVANEVGVGVSVGFRQQLSYGGDLYGIGGETEITASVSAEYKRAWDTSRSRGFEIESKRSFLEKARRRTVFDRVEQVGPAKQMIKVKGELTFGVRIHSRGNWVHDWPDRRSMLANWQGIESGKDVFLDFYRHHPVPDAANNPAFNKVYAVVERERQFEDTTNVIVDIRDMPIED